METNMNVPTSAVWLKFSKVTEGLVQYTGPKWMIVRANAIVYDDRGRMAIKTSGLPLDFELPRPLADKLIAELGKYKGTTPLDEVFVHLDSIRSKKGCCSKEICEQRVCPYCATLTGIPLSGELCSPMLIQETRSFTPFFRVILKSHDMPRSTALAVMTDLQRRHPHYAFFIPAGDRYGCCVLRAIRCVAGRHSEALNQYVLMLYDRYRKKLDKRVKWPILFPLSLLSGHAAAIARTVAEGLALDPPMLDMTERIAQRLKGFVPFNVFIGDYLPDAVIRNLGMAAKARGVGTAFLKNSYCFESITSVSDLANAMELVPDIETCPCGVRPSGSLTSHILTCGYFLERGVICGCGEEFGPRSVWAYVDHIQTCFHSNTKKSFLRRSPD